MPKYVICQHELWNRELAVEASTPEEAHERYLRNRKLGWEEIQLRLCHTYEDVKVPEWMVGKDGNLKCVEEGE